MELKQEQEYGPMEHDRNTERNSCPNGPLIYDKGGSNVQWRKDKLFYKWCWKILTANGKRMKLGHSLLVVQWPSRVWHFVKLWMAALQVSLSSTVSWSLPGSYPLPQWWHPTFSSLSLASHSAFRLSQHQGLFQWVGSSHQVAKVLELQLQQQSFQWLFRVDFLQDWLVCSPCCPRDSQESSPAPQFENINSSVLSLFYGPTLTSVHDYWKTIALTIWTLVAKWCLYFFMCCLGLS